MSEVKVNKITPRSGTAVTIGDAGDTVSFPSGAVSNSDLPGSGQITINGQAVALGGSITLTTETRPTVSGISPSAIENTQTAVVITGTNFVSVPLVQAINSSTGALNVWSGSAWVAIQADTDVKVSVSANDTKPNFLLAKLTAGTNISLTETNDGGNETITITNTGEDPTALAIALG